MASLDMLIEDGVLPRFIEESAWWWEAVNVKMPPLHDDTPPQPGYYKRRLVPRGPFVAARIWIQRWEDAGEIIADDRYGCEVDGAEADAFEQWPYLCKYPITKEEWSAFA